MLYTEVVKENEGHFEIEYLYTELTDFLILKFNLIEMT
jgi:hypothetical protein